MKKLQYIFMLFFILSCNDFDEILDSLEENETILENDYLIKEAWIKIEEGTTESLLRASDIFNDIIF